MVHSRARLVSAASGKRGFDSRHVHHLLEYVPTVLSLICSMNDASIVERRLQEQALKERMLVDAIFILATVERIENQLEQKLLEIDAAELYNNEDELPRLRNQVLGLVAKLRREEARMDEYLVKYRKLVYEKKEILPRALKARKVYLRGVSPLTRGQAQSESLASQDAQTTQGRFRREVV